MPLGETIHGWRLSLDIVCAMLSCTYPCNPLSKYNLLPSLSGQAGWQSSFPTKIKGKRGELSALFLFYFNSGCRSLILLHSRIPEVLLLAIKNITSFSTSFPPPIVFFKMGTGGNMERPHIQSAPFQNGSALRSRFQNPSSPSSPSVCVCV